MSDDVKQIIRGSVVAIVVYIACAPVRKLIWWGIDVILVLAVIAATSVCLFNSRIEKKKRYFCYGLLLGSTIMWVIGLYLSVILSDILYTWYLEGGAPQ